MRSRDCSKPIASLGLSSSASAIKNEKREQGSDAVTGGEVKNNYCACLTSRWIVVPFYEIRLQTEFTVPINQAPFCVITIKPLNDLQCSRECKIQKAKQYRTRRR
jgi:hypothetical protein